MRLIAKITILLLLCFSNFSLFAQQPGAKRIAIVKNDYQRRDPFVDAERFIGNVTLEHNGTVMDCDSAYVYAGGEFVAYGHVVVTAPKGTVLKGDSIRYSSNTNVAEVRGKLVYLIDSSAVLRSTAIDFNTKEEIGFFKEEGTIKDSTRTIESKQGYYYSKNKNFVFIGEVKVNTTEYIMRSDSLVYNTDTKVFDFYSHTHIWGDKGYLYCNTGWYNSESDELFFTKDSYILSETQEIIADTIFYENKIGKGKLYSNIQIIDTAQKLIALADLALFNLKTEDFELQKKPAVIMYTEDNDSVFIKAKLIKSLVVPIPKIEELPNLDEEDFESNNLPNMSINRLPNEMEGNESGRNQLLEEDMLNDSTKIANDKNIPINTESEKIEEITSDILEDKEIEEENLEEKIEDVIPNIQEESDTTIRVAKINDSVKLETETKKADSTFRQIFALKEVLSFSQDMQSSCDSLYFNTHDSITKMFVDPIVWSRAEAQITADSTYVFSENGDLDRAEFYSKAFIVLPENGTDTSKFFHQIKGRKSIFYFQNKEIHKMDVLGNTQSIFYSTSDRTANFTESSSLTAIFENRKIRKATYITDVSTENLPLNTVTVDKSKLEGFAWHGDKRPKTREDITTRRIREHRVADYKIIVRPEFVITEKIDKIEKEL